MLTIKIDLRSFCACPRFFRLMPLLNLPISNRNQLELANNPQWSWISTIPDLPTSAPIPVGSSKSMAGL